MPTGVRLIMAHPVSEAFSIWRQIGQIQDLPVLEAAPCAEPGARITLWPGALPELPIGAHPLLAVPLAHGTFEAREIWVEDRPPGVLLSDLPGPISLEDATHIGAQLADALGTLHVRGHSHGDVRAERVVLTMDGMPTLIGAGTMPGSPSADLDAVLELVHQLGGTPLSLSVESAAALAAGLRELGSASESVSTDLRETIECAMLPPPAQPQVVHIQLTPLGHHDEVQPDLGPDERARGLLDRWSNTGSVEEFTDDRTEAISATELAAQGRRVMLERLHDLYQRPNLAGRFGAHEGIPCEPLKALIADAAMDPLPPPDGVLRRDPVISETESTVEVTQEAPAMPPYAADEPTGETTEWTGGETTIPRAPQSQRIMMGLFIGITAVVFALAVAVYFISGAS